MEPSGSSSLPNRPQHSPVCPGSRWQNTASFPRWRLPHTLEFGIDDFLPASGPPGMEHFGHDRKEKIELVTATLGYRRVAHSFVDKIHHCPKLRNNAEGFHLSLRFFHHC